MEHTIDFAPCYTGLDLINQPRKPWLVRGLIRESSFSVISGMPGSFKSFAMIDLAHAIATGGDWFGQSSRQHPVLYVAAERGAYMGERVEALRRTKGVDPKAVNYFTAPFMIDLDDDFDRLVGSIEEAEINPRVILFDTFRASFSGDENSNVDTQRLVRAVDDLRARYEATVLMTHHVNKFTRQLRGSSVLLGAVDHELYMTETKVGANIKARKTNHGVKWLTLKLRSEVVDLGVDPIDGDTYSSVVLHLIEQAETTKDSDDVVDEMDPKLAVILTVLTDEPVALYGVWNALKDIETQTRNRDALKRDLELLSPEHVEIIEVNGNTRYRRKAA